MKRTALLPLAGIMVLPAFFLSACQEEKSLASSWAKSANATTVIIDNFAFYPPVLKVPRETTVTWINKYPVAHRIASDGASPNFTSASLGTGSYFSFTFSGAGNYTYYCANHPTMKGTIVVK